MTETFLKSLKEKAEKATPTGERCPEKLYIFSESGDLVMQVRGLGSQGTEDPLPMDDNYEFYYAANPAAILKLIEAHEIMSEALGLISFDYGTEHEDARVRAAKEAIECVAKLLEETK